MRRQASEPKKRDALGKAFQLLCWMIDTGESKDKLQWGVREIGEALHMPPASVHRLLSSLVEQGWVTQNLDSGQYQIGAEFCRLGLKLSSHFTIRNVGVAVMQDLVTACKETALLRLYDSSRMEMMFIAIRRSWRKNSSRSVFGGMPVPMGIGTSGQWLLPLRSGGPMPASWAA